MMNKPLVFRDLCIAVVASVCFATMAFAAVASRPVPDLGLITNADGDNAFRADTLEESRKLLRGEVDGYADIGIKTLTYSIGAGSEILLYPTKVSNTWGWRKTKYDADPAWGPRIERNRKQIEAGGDGPRTAGEQAKRRGMFFFPSQRMNDGHYAFGQPPEEYPLSGKFWLENRDLEIKDSPVKGRPEYGHLLDYSHAKVREYRLAQAYEAIDRYQDVMDGYELDFTRFQVFFPAGKGWERRDLMTDLVRRVRQRLDERGRTNGKSYVLIARVPPAPHNCKWAGLDVAKWADEGLVDVLSPAQMMNMGFEQPIDEFKKMVGPSGVRVYAGLLPRVGWGWAFTAVEKPGVKDFGTPDRALSIPQLRAAVANAYHLGADGIYLFNFSHYARWGKPTSGPDAVRITEPATLASQDKVFSISKAYWFDHEDGYEYRKQLPAEIPLGEGSRSFQLLVGTDLTDAKARTAVRRAILRLGFRDVAPGMTITVSLNGHSLVARATDAAVATTDPADMENAKILKGQKDLASHAVAIPLKDLSMLRQGRNAITVEITTAAGGGTKGPLLTDVDLGLFYGDDGRAAAASR
jgi:hypothetical protein